MTKNSKLALSILIILVLAGLLLYFSLTPTKSPPIDYTTEEEKELATLQKLAEESNFTPTTEQEQLDIMSNLGNN